MSQIHESKDPSDLNPLYAPLGLFLKPISRINITIHFPELKQSLPSGGKSVSSWDIIERLKTLINPETFISIKTVKNTLEFMRFEGDLENKGVLKTVIGRLDGKKLKVTGIKEPLKILAAEGKVPFPSKYDWDSFFRDARNMNEMKAGERPDTIHFQHLPTSWFSSRSKNKTSQQNDTPDVPSEKIFKRVWENFGEVRFVDIPILDPYRSQMKSSISGVRTFTFNHDKVFEAYVQFKEYMSFVKVMDALRGTFLCYKSGPGDKLLVASVKVDFDKSKHLSDESIRAREMEVERLSALDKKGVKKSVIKIDPKIKSVSLRDIKSSSTSKVVKSKVDPSIDEKIVMEERKYLVARRKLEAIRLLDFLFARVKETRETKQEEEAKRLEEKRLKAERKRHEHLEFERKRQENLEFERKRKLEEEDAIRRKRELSKDFPSTRNYEYTHREHYDERRDFRGPGQEDRSELVDRRNHFATSNYPQDYHNRRDPYGINSDLDRAYEKYFKSISKRSD